MIVGKIGKDGIYRRPGDPGFDDCGKEDRPLMGIPAIREDKPHRSTAAAVHPDQVDRMNKAAVSGVHYERGTGAMISTSKQARQREMIRRNEGKVFNQ